jgi:hypothetical protein
MGIALAPSSKYAETCRSNCSAEEFEALERAFFRKAENLARVREQREE